MEPVVKTKVKLFHYFSMRQDKVRSIREDISERTRRMLLNNRREVNRIIAELHITGTLFVPSSDNPLIAPAAAMLMSGFSQYSNREFTVMVPVTTFDETPLNLTALGGYEAGISGDYEAGGSSGYEAGGSGGYEAGGSFTCAGAGQSR